MLACFRYPNESMDHYMKRTKMQSLAIDPWATEFEILAAASTNICFCILESILQMA